MNNIVVALIFNAMDLITGIVAAVRNKNITSSALRDGMFKKIGFIFCYILGYVLDNVGPSIGFELAVNILPVVVLYSCTTEVVSIIENICKINPDFIPDKLLEMFHVKHTDKEE